MTMVVGNPENDPLTSIAHHESPNAIQTQIRFLLSRKFAEQINGTVFQNELLARRKFEQEIAHGRRSEQHDVRRSAGICKDVEQGFPHGMILERRTQQLN